jgi:alkylhydroperoxidase family enzyme
MRVRRGKASNACTHWRLGAKLPFSQTRERAALDWTEALTLIARTHAPDDIYDALKLHFSEKEIVDLTLVIGTINLWNRLAISLRAVPGHYRPTKAAAV